MSEKVPVEEQGDVGKRGSVNKGFTANKVVQILLIVVLVVVTGLGYSLWGSAQAAYSNAKAENATLSAQVDDLKTKIDLLKAQTAQPSNPVAIADPNNKDTITKEVSREVSKPLEETAGSVNEYLKSLWPTKAPEKFVNGLKIISTQTRNFWEMLQDEWVRKSFQLLSVEGPVYNKTKSFGGNGIASEDIGYKTDINLLDARRIDDIAKLYKKFSSRSLLATCTEGAKLEDGIFKLSTVKTVGLKWRVVIEYQDSAPGSILPSELFYPAHYAMYFGGTYGLYNISIGNEFHCTNFKFTPGDFETDTKISIRWETNEMWVFPETNYLEKKCIELRRRLRESTCYPAIPTKVFSTKMFW